MTLMIVQKEKKSLETRRLDLDAAKTKLKRTKPEHKEAVSWPSNIISLPLANTSAFSFSYESVMCLSDIWVPGVVVVVILVVFGSQVLSASTQLVINCVNTTWTYRPFRLIFQKLYGMLYGRCYLTDYHCVNHYLLSFSLHCLNFVSIYLSPLLFISR